jgi:hypothetical protein
MGLGAMEAWGSGPPEKWEAQPQSQGGGRGYSSALAQQAKSGGLGPWAVKGQGGQEKSQQAKGHGMSLGARGMQSSMEGSGGRLSAVEPGQRQPRVDRDAGTMFNSPAGGATRPPNQSGALTKSRWSGDDGGEDTGGGNGHGDTWGSGGLATTGPGKQVNVLPKLALTAGDKAKAKHAVPVGTIFERDSPRAKDTLR